MPPVLSWKTLLLTREPAGDSGITAVSVSSTGWDGSPCGADGRTGCWVAVAALKINPPAFDALDEEQRVAAVLQGLINLVGLGPPVCAAAPPSPACSGGSPVALDVETIAGLNELLSATLSRLQG